MIAKTKGFTLIETVMYLALLSVVMAITLPAFYFLTNSVEHDKFELIRSEETSFVLAKVSQLIAAAASIEEPRPNEMGDTLKIKVSSNPWPESNVTIGLENDALFVEREGVGGNGGGRETLNTSRVTISNLKFTNILPGEHARPSIGFSFTVDSHFVATTTIEISRYE